MVENGPTRPGRTPLLARLLSSSLGLIVAVLALMWVIELVDQIILNDRLQSRHGIVPRRVDGLDGLALAPVLHAGFGHLLSNSVPFLALGWLVALRGKGHWMAVTVLVALGGGALTWLLAGGGNHIGASGIVFGYFGSLLGSAFTDRRPAVLAPALIALFLYGGLLAGIVPQGQISWEGHLFGLVVGFAAGRWLSERPAPDPGDDDGIVYPWEASEPWLDTD